MGFLDGGDAASLEYTTNPCIPTNAIWMDPSVTVPPEGATADEMELLALQVDIATSLGWTTLQTLTAGQIALCPITVRPCRGWGRGGSYLIAPILGPAGAPFWPLFVDGGAVNILCGHRDGCECEWVQEIVLPGPVGVIDNVTIDGEVLDPSAYRLDNNNKLVRQDGGAWPYWQNFNLPLGEVGTFSVTYFNGFSSDLLVRYAAGVLATEYLLAVQNQQCRLPAGLTQIVRQGMTMEVNADIMNDGLTGIPEVDAVTARFNPNRLRSPSAFFSLDSNPRLTPTPYPQGS